MPDTRDLRSLPILRERQREHCMRIAAVIFENALHIIATTTLVLDTRELLKQVNLLLDDLRGAGLAAGADRSGRPAQVQPPIE